MSRVLVLGYLGLVSNWVDGQTVKTRDLYRLAQEQIGKENVDYYDTEELRSNKLSIFTMLKKVARCDTLFYLPAQNNLAVFFPVIFLLSIISRVRIHYFVVGGWLREFLTHLPLHRVMLRKIAGIHAETLRLKKELEDFYRFKNVDTFPNFRFFEFNPIRSKSDKLRIVFMARINKLKGLDWIFELAEYIAKNKLENKLCITFYGPYYEGDKQYFDENVAKYSFVEYKGVLQPDVIHETLSHYDVMLLPTHYYTEGLPGSVVDAYIAGIPVIVSEWKHSHEFIDDNKSGFIVPFNEGQKQMIDKVMLLVKDRSLLYKMQNYALEKRMMFAPPMLDKFLI